MTNRFAVLTATSAAALLLLTGCTFDANLTTEPEKIEELAADALENETGMRPDAVDCGEDSIPLVQDSTIDCTVTTDGVELDAVVTFTKVDGTNISINVTTGALPEPTETPSDPGTLSIPRADLAELAVTTLEPQYGSTPVVICAGNDIPLVVGTEIECVVRVPATGAEGVGTITITRVEGTAYSIDIQVRDA